MDQGGEAGGALDAPVVSSVPGERGPAAAERAGLQPREPLAAAGAAGADRHLVADKSPAAPRQDGWTADQARPLLLAPAGGESPDPTSIRVDVGADLGSARADRLTRVANARARPGEERTHAWRAVREMPRSRGAPVDSTWRRTQLTVSGAD